MIIPAVRVTIAGSRFSNVKSQFFSFRASCDEVT